MSVKVEQIEKNKVKLEITVPASVFSEGLTTAYGKQRGQLSVPGFRKGKAPRKVIERMYGEGVFYEEAFRAVYPEAYDKAVEEQGIRPVEAPQLDIVEIGEGKELVFTAQVAVYPEVELGDYKGIEVEHAAYTVTDAEVEAEINKALERVATWETAERPAKEGDRVTIDYKGSVDGVPFAGGEAQDTALEIGQGRFIPGFEEQLVGLVAGDEKEINVTFPEQYHAEELAGKPAVFAIKVKDVKEKNVPALDDDFASEASEFETLAEYRSDVRAKLEKSAQDRSKNELENLVIQKAAQNAVIDIPEAMIMRQVEYMAQEMEMRLSYQGLNMQQYMSITGTKPEDLIAQMQPEAASRVRTQLVLEAIRKAEGIEASEAEVEEKIKERAERTNKTVEEVKASLHEHDFEYMRDEVMLGKTIDLVVSSAVVTQPQPKAEEEQPKE